MTSRERDLREMMQRQIAQLDRRPAATPRMLRRARRRRVGTAGLTAALVVATVVGAGALGRTLALDRATGPTEPSPTRVVLSANGDIAFLARSADNGSLYLADAAGGEPQILDACPGDCDGMAIMSVDWSPDGTKIAYSIGSASGASIGDLAGIYVLDIGTGASTQLTHCVRPCVRQGAVDGGLDWSPDGSRIAFDEAVDDLCDSPSQFRGTCGIYTISADGSDRARLPTGSVDDPVGPSWSPDGTHIAFSARVDQDWFVYAMGVDGSGLSRLSGDRPSRASNQAAWSPTGAEIAFEVVSGHPESPVCQLWLFDPDGSGDRQVSEGCEMGGHVFARSGSGPEWSPDGTMIAFYNGDGLQVINADGSGRIELAPRGGGRAMGLVAWQPLPEAPPSA